MELFNTFSKYIYGQKYYPEIDFKYAWSKGCLPKHKYYVWNNYKRKMMLLKGLNYIDEDDGVGHFHYEYLQSVLHGYKFTFKEHIYEKDKIYYEYNSEGRFNKIKLDSIE